MVRMGEVISINRGEVVNFYVDLPAWKNVGICSLLCRGFSDGGVLSDKTTWHFGVAIDVHPFVCAVDFSREIKAPSSLKGSSLPTFTRVSGLLKRSP